MPETMQAAVFMGNGVLELQQRAVPRIQGRDDVLLRVRAASVCGSDIQILNVPPGHPATVGAILGHEYVGEVLAAGEDVRHVRPGDHVIPSPDLRCGYCFYCQRGLTHMCENRTTLGIFLDGGFAPYNVAPARALFKVSKDVPVDVAAIGEPLMCAMSGMRQLCVQPGESVVVLGAGPLGLLFALLARSVGAGTVIVSEPAEGRRMRADALKVDAVVNPLEQDLKQVVLGMTPRGADVVIDAVGSLFRQAIDITRRSARILLFGVNTRAETSLKQYDLIEKQLTVLTAYIFANELFPAMISVLESGALPLETLITHRLPLERIHEGIRLLRSGEAVKAIIHP